MKMYKILAEVISDLREIAYDARDAASSFSSLVVKTLMPAEDPDEYEITITPAPQLQPVQLQRSPTPIILTPMEQLTMRASSGDIAQFYNVFQSIVNLDPNTLLDFIANEKIQTLLTNIVPESYQVGDILTLYMLCQTIDAKYPSSYIITQTIHEIRAEIAEALKIFDSNDLGVLERDRAFGEAFINAISTRKHQIEKDELNILIPDPLSMQFEIIGENDVPHDMPHDVLRLHL